MSNFQERLLSALKDDIASRPVVTGTAPVRRSRRLLGTAVAVTGAAAAATVAITVFAGGSTPAFAVDERPDGSIEVRISEFRDPSELEAKLESAGVNAEVDYLPVGQTCKSPRGKGSAGGGRFEASVGRQSGGGIVFKIEKGRVRADQTLVLTVSSDQDRPAEPPTSLHLQIVEGDVSPCEVVSMPMPSGPAPTGHQPSGVETGNGEEPGLSVNNG
ncbi:hypothetical protein AB0B45_35395 [Nonomuraea sp. NPDC049152]|uniref:hypothetical protein n=1 Tax=Nonomuraea sp. NPDC049152 TaxID=3154350 RepID=UPI0033E3E459